VCGIKTAALNAQMNFAAPLETGGKTISVDTAVRWVVTAKGNK